MWVTRGEQVASYVSANLDLGEGAEVPWKELFIGPGCSASVELIARNVTKIGGGDEVRPRGELRCRWQTEGGDVPPPFLFYLPGRCARAALCWRNDRTCIRTR